MNTQLRQIIADTLGIAAESIDTETAAANTPAWDSVNHLNLCLSIEQEFGIELSPEQMMELTSVAAMEQMLAEHLAK